MMPFPSFWITTLSTAVVLAVTITLLYRHYSLRRLNAIRRMISELAKGNFTNRLNIYADQSLSDLSRSLNELAAQFQNRLIEITNDKEKLEAILSSMVEGVIVIAPDGRLQHLSPNVMQMLELRSKDTDKRLYWEIIGNQEITNALRESLKQKKALCQEVRILGGQEGFFNMQLSPVVDKRGELISLVAVFHDITELKRLEKLRSEFVANVSHELKTPLTAIKGFVETLRSGAKEDPQAAGRFLEIIANQTERLENLVNDLLILSSMESREVEMEIVPEDIGQIIQSVLQIQKTQIEKHQLEIRVEIPTQLPKVLGDRMRMEQVFINLLDNAVKFTQPQGTVTIRFVKENGFIRTDITDTGIGIEPHHLSRLFERFYRVDKARSRDTGGTGLGLSIVKHIVYAHQGKLSVVSTPGKGSTFSVYLPHSASY